MTAVPRELARKRPANTPARQNPQVIEGEFRIRRHPGLLATRFLILMVLACLFAGFVLSMTQQHT